jgi:hypothetical protein
MPGQRACCWDFRVEGVTKLRNALKNNVAGFDDDLWESKTHGRAFARLPEVERPKVSHLKSYSGPSPIKKQAGRVPEALGNGMDGSENKANLLWTTHLNSSRQYSESKDQSDGASKTVLCIIAN